MARLKKKKKLHIDKDLRIMVYVWGLVVGMMLLVSSSYAWYTLNTREAETVTPNVMKPYNLELQDATGSVSKQLSIGGLQQGEIKQIVFSVTNKENPQINKNKTAFDYALELIYTNNLALQYEIYPLISVQNPDENSLATQETVTVTEGEGENATTVEQVVTSYWEKDATALDGEDVSGIRWSQAGLTNVVDDENTNENEADAPTADIINRGTYISYEKKTDNLGAVLNGNMKLDAGEDAYATQYYVLEIQWSIDEGFEKYDKETDMIYVVAKAVQPEPEVN